MVELVKQKFDIDKYSMLGRCPNMFYSMYLIQNKINYSFEYLFDGFYYNKIEEIINKTVYTNIFILKVD